MSVSWIPFCTAYQTISARTENYARTTPSLEEIAQLERDVDDFSLRLPQNDNNAMFALFRNAVVSARELAASLHRIWTIQIEDTTYSSPFAQFFQRCCKPVLNPEHLIPAFKELPLEEQWQICHLAKAALRIDVDYWQPDEFFTHEYFSLQAFKDCLEHAYLPGKVNAFSDKDALFALVDEMARREGVIIEDWDREWGKYHVHDAPRRLVKALCVLEQKTIAGQLRGIHEGLRQEFGEEIAYRVVQNCPLLLFLKRGISQSVDLTELRQRAEKLHFLESQKNQLQIKYPQLDFKGWKDQETFLLMFPESLGEREQVRFGYFTSVVQELIVGDYDLVSAQLILDKLLTRESFHSFSSDLASHMRLLEIKRIAQRQIAEFSLNRGQESLCKDIFVVPSQTDIQGKFKPLTAYEARKEAFGYHCDRALGIGMTAPTMRINPLDLDTQNQIFYYLGERLNKIKELFSHASQLRFENAPEWEANEKMNQAFTLLFASEIPSVVRNSLFAETYRLYGEERQVDQLGQLLFCNWDGYGITDCQREALVFNYINSEAFSALRWTLDYQGSVQIWLNHCSKRAWEYLVKDTAGGAKLKTAPKVLAHFYALLGIVKGSMDCASGNTLVEFDESANRIANFWDMDDERSMPHSNDFWHIRLWQMGLPQCALPFNKAFLLLFSEPGLLKKLYRMHASSQIDYVAKEAQSKRLETIIAMFAQELQKETITLTPRELFFRMFPGSRDDFDRIKEGFNNDKRFSEEGIRISAIELFEFHLPEMGRTAWYTGDEREQSIVGDNMRALYHPKLP